MKKIVLSLGAVCLLPFCLLACTTQTEDTGNSQPSSSETTEETTMTVAEFLDKVATANEDVETVHFDLDLSLQVNDETKTQVMKADIDYGNNGQTIQRVNAVIEEVNNGVESYQEFIFTDDADYSIYSRASENGDWIKQTSGGQFYIQPGYFSFLEILYSMENDLELTESDDEYTLVLKSQNIDLISLFEEELNLYITGISQTEVDKVFEVTFDKDDLYMTGFKMTFDYDGDAGMVDMDIKTDFSDWNQVDDTVFEAPKDMTI